MDIRFLLGALAAFCLAVPAFGQISKVALPPTASVTGQVKNADKPAGGVAVTLFSPDTRAGLDQTKRTTTDSDGRYKFTDLTAGNYRVNVLAPGYIVFADTSVVRNGQQVTLKDGEAAERIDFTLTRGGVITGKATSVDNRPVIGEPVSIVTMDSAGKQTEFNTPGGVNFRTDDRGNYRVYGLPPGTYYVSVGRGDIRGGGPMFAGAFRSYQRTFHPNTSNPSEATAVTVEAGQEVTGVDIRMVSVETYAATGRVVDGETGKPLPGILIAHAVSAGNRRGQGGAGIGGPGMTDGISGNDGEFRIEGLINGKYVAYLPQDGSSSEYYSEPAQFEIQKADVDGIEVKLKRASSVSGTVILDGNTDPNILSSLQVTAMVRGSGAMGPNSTTVAPNGMFQISGLAPGRLSLNVVDTRNPGPGSGLTVTRIERDGADASSGITLNQGEQATGVRVYISFGTGVIRGLVRVDGGTLTPNMRLMVFARRTDNGGGGGGGGMMGGGAFPAQVDANGRFQIEQLVGGTYDVTLIVPGTRPQGAPGQQGGQAQMAASAPHQTVVLTNGGTQDVVLTVAFSALPTPGTRGNGRGIGPGGGPGQGNGPGNPPPGGTPRRRGGE